MRALQRDSISTTVLIQTRAASARSRRRRARLDRDLEPGFHAVRACSNEGGSIVTRPLPKPSIDTGAGLERLASVVQGVRTNYGVDLLSNLVFEAAELAKKPYGGTMAPDDVSMRVIADHARRLPS